MAHRFYRYGGRRTQLAKPNGRLATACRRGGGQVVHRAHRDTFAATANHDNARTGHGRANQPAGLTSSITRCSAPSACTRARLPGPRVGTTLHNPDFAAVAQAYGAHGEVVNTTEEFAPALQRALAHAKAHNLPALIELRYDGNLITPNATLATIRATAEKAQAAK